MEKFGLGWDVLGEEGEEIVGRRAGNDFGRNEIISNKMYDRYACR